MKALQRHQQKKYRSQIIGYLFLLLIIIIFIATVGIKLLIGTSLLIINLTQPNKKEQNANETPTDLILPPEIFNLKTATNTAEIIINGRALAGKKLSFYVNDIKQKEITPDDETFETDIHLEKGNNTIYLVMSDQKTKSKKTSKSYTILYKDEKPSLEIISPHDLDKTSKGEIQIDGATETEVTIRINNLPIIIDPEGKFTYVYKLKEGENHIAIEAKDIADNSEVKELTIYYQKED